MNEYNSERSKAWNIYTSSDPTPTPSQTISEREATPWKDNYSSPMNAISFGFVATAILISMFLIMAIFEHLFKPNYLPSRGTDRSSVEMEKFRSPEAMSTSYSSDFSVVMPGQHYPTYIAHHVPLPSCPREGVFWPSHQHTISLPPS